MTPTQHIHNGEALAWLSSLDDGIADAVICDPPYSSGGLHLTDRTRGTREKYSGLKKRSPLGDFAGDHRDGRSWSHWMALWLYEAHRVTRPGGVICMSTDWRQFPSATDALQAGGWVWRGIVPWIKPDARPQMGRFTQNAEFVVWGSHGQMPAEGPCLPGYYISRAPRAQDDGPDRRIHLTQKPLEVVRSLIRIAPPGGLVVDPFAGSGTTLVAARLEGRAALGCEVDPDIHDAAQARLAATVHTPTLTDQETTR